MNTPAFKINYCDKNAECTATDMEPQEQCRHFQCLTTPQTYCDHLTWWGGCMCEAAAREAKDGSGDSLMRGGAMVAHEAHNLEVPGSNPGPATNTQSGAPVGSGDK